MTTIIKKAPRGDDTALPVLGQQNVRSRTTELWERHLRKTYGLPSGFATPMPPFSNCRVSNMVVRSSEELPTVGGVALQANTPSLTQAKAALQAGLIQPEYAAIFVLVWAEVHLGLEVRP